MYAINNIPITDWGLRSAAIGGSGVGYLLSGIWSLPKRLGDTYYDWEGSLEPYADIDDIYLAGRDLTLRLACSAATAQQLQVLITKFKADLPNSFTLSHNVLGAFVVGLQSVDIKIYGGRWAALTLKLKEPNPTLGSALPLRDNGVFGIDGYSWEQLGFVVKTIEGRSITSWKELSVTADPRYDAWKPGRRPAESITIKGTIKGSTYEDFNTKIKRLQTLFSAAGIRSVKCPDGSIFTAFCVDGFDVDVCDFRPIHWGKFTCKMIVV